MIISFTHRSVPEFIESLNLKEGKASRGLLRGGCRLISIPGLLAGQGYKLLSP